MGDHWLVGSVAVMKFPASVEEVCARFKDRAHLGPVLMFKVFWFQQVRLVSPEALKVVAQSNVNIRKCTYCHRDLDPCAMVCVVECLILSRCTLMCRAVRCALVCRRSTKSDLHSCCVR